MEFSQEIRRAIRNYEAIEADGLTLHPIRVAEWDEFSDARAAVTCVQQALPVRYAGMPLLQAYYQMELEAIQAGNLPIGLFYRAILFLAMSLQIGQGKRPKERVRMFAPVIDRETPLRLKALRFVQDGEKLMEITPVQFQRIRPILAAQNGLELVSEDANPELLEAERDLAEKANRRLDIQDEDMMTTVCALSGTEPEDMMNWPVLRLLDRKRALSRVLGYLICGVGEAMGTTWKGGNPYPSPFYDARKERSTALQPLDGFAGGEGTKAVARSIGKQAESITK